LNLNFGGSCEIPNFLFKDTLYFGILLTSLAPAGSKNKKTTHFSSKIRPDRLLGREEEQEKLRPRFLVGVCQAPTSNPPLGRGWPKGCQSLDAKF
jgi:hypothetical protein